MDGGHTLERCRVVTVLGMGEDGHVASLFPHAAELAAACDLRLAADSAIFGMPEVRLGIPSVVEAALLPALIGWGRTREMLLLGDPLPSTRLHALGLIARCVPPDQLDATVAGLVAELAALPQPALRTLKRAGLVRGSRLTQAGEQLRQAAILQSLVT